MSIEEMGMTKEQQEQFLSQCHQQIQLLGQALVLGHHNTSLVTQYHQDNSGYLFETDEALFDIIEQNHPDARPNKSANDIFNHACHLRELAFSQIPFPRFGEEAETVQLSKAASHALLNHYAFPFPELLPLSSEIWIRPGSKSKLSVPL